MPTCGAWRVGGVFGTPIRGMFRRGSPFGKVPSGLEDDLALPSLPIDTITKKNVLQVELGALVRGKPGWSCPCSHSAW